MAACALEHSKNQQSVPADPDPESVIASAPVNRSWLARRSPTFRRVSNGFAES